jgi:hypothetical protein
MKKINNYQYYFLALLFVFLSSLRIQYLPEIQLLLFIASLIFIRNKKIIAFILITILCSHFYAIPDVYYRFNSHEYPSIYTKNIIASIKGIDIIAVVLFIFSYQKILNLINLIKIPLPWILSLIAILASFFSYIIFPELDAFYARGYLYLVRNILLVLGFYLLTYKLNQNHLKQIAWLASFSWVMKMVFAILFPSENLWIRESTLDRTELSTMYFAGDEYIVIPLYVGVILALVEKKNKLDYILLFSIVIAVTVLALIADRRSVIGISVFMIAAIFIKKIDNKKLDMIASFLIFIISAFTAAFFLLFCVQFLPLSAQIAFKVNQYLLSSAIDSVIFNLTKNPITLMFGLGADVPYEIINLNSIVDNEYAWGDKTGSAYRVALWYFPFGRLILNVGVIGAFLYLRYLCRIFVKYDFITCYLLFTASGLTILNSPTPVNAIAMGLGLSALSFKFANKRQYNQYALSLLKT